MSIDSIEVWPKAESLIQSVYDDRAACYLVWCNDDGQEVNTPVDDVVMMIIKDDEVGLCWYECWLSTYGHPPVTYVEGITFVNKDTGEELYFDVYEVEKNIRGKTVGYELLTETYHYK